MLTKPFKCIGRYILVLRHVMDFLPRHFFCNISFRTSRLREKHSWRDNIFFGQFDPKLFGLEIRLLLRVCPATLQGFTPRYFLQDYAYWAFYHLLMACRNFFFGIWFLHDRYIYFRTSLLRAFLEKLCGIMDLLLLSVGTVSSRLLTIIETVIVPPPSYGGLYQSLKTTT